ncbi:MAG: endolytic transglycosylase MltG [Vicinamibacterales bacterium]
MAKWLLRLSLVAVVGLGAAAGGAWWLREQARSPYRGFSGDHVFVDIPSGTGPRSIGARLAAAGVVRDERTFRVALWLTGRARDLQAGEYRFEGAHSAVDIALVLARGAIYTQPITFREGLTIAEMAEVFAQSGLGPTGAFRAAAGDASLIRDLDPEAEDLEGYLFPDTYPVPRRVAAGTLVAQMVRGFRAALTPDLIARAAADGLTVRQVVTLAALVEKETARDAERPLVAAVYRNRFRIGMGMQADPTVIYALQRAGKWDGNLSRDDLQFDSPYNTYRYGGLPPGPIAAPGRRALEAVVSPAAVDYLYFVSRNDGTHVFSRTLAEHNRNVYEWQVKYFRDRRARARLDAQDPSGR